MPCSSEWMDELSIFYLTIWSWYPVLQTHVWTHIYTHHLGLLFPILPCLYRSIFAPIVPLLLLIHELQLNLKWSSEFFCKDSLEHNLLDKAHLFPRCSTNGSVFFYFCSFFSVQLDGFHDPLSLHRRWQRKRSFQHTPIGPRLRNGKAWLVTAWIGLIKTCQLECNAAFRSQYVSLFLICKKETKYQAQMRPHWAGHTRAAPGNTEGVLSGGDLLSSLRATPWSDGRPRTSDKGDDQCLCATQGYAAGIG